MNPIDINEARKDYDGINQAYFDNLNGMPFRPLRNDEWTEKSILFHASGKVSIMADDIKDDGTYAIILLDAKEARNVFEFLKQMYGEQGEGQDYGDAGPN